MQLYEWRIFMSLVTFIHAIINFYGLSAELFAFLTDTTGLSYTYIMNRCNDWRAISGRLLHIQLLHSIHNVQTLNIWFCNVEFDFHEGKKKLIVVKIRRTRSTSITVFSIIMYVQEAHFSVFFYLLKRYLKLELHSICEYETSKCSFSPMCHYSDGSNNNNWKCSKISLVCRLPASVPLKRCKWNADAQIVAHENGEDDTRRDRVMHTDVKIEF